MKFFVDKGGLFLSYNKRKIKIKMNTKGLYSFYIQNYLDVFCKESLPQHSLRNTNYLILDEFNVQNPLEADILIYLILQ